ncbi:MAG: deoxyuridine 5'-triphosphate nucleotidohydrolase [Methanobacteriaceae archaeon]|nr:deoxyuridine 5'-triphosphate nucleotidohydrolase [Methanobacteriaceae archaeon]MDZ4172356.1 deoxyuridine 5'-triphosphate nucleotidohydrolase [Methanobacteriaceae archaeon]
MLGEKELIKLFPEFKELVEPSGIDLRLDEIFIQTGPGSLIDNEKNLPPLQKMEPPIYNLQPKTAYLATIDRKIKIPEGFSMLYLPRSTLLRSFVSVQTAVGDPNFYGTLNFMLYNYGEFEYTIKQGERIVQGVVFDVKGSGKYNGSYQEEEE